MAAGDNPPSEGNSSAATTGIPRSNCRGQRREGITRVEHCETPISAPDVRFSLTVRLKSLRAGAGCSTEMAISVKEMGISLTEMGVSVRAEGGSFTAEGFGFTAEGLALTAAGVSIRKWGFL